MKRPLLVVVGVIVAAAVVLTAAAVANAPPENPATAGSDEDFVPSEQLPADSAISFPVDI